MMTKAAGPIALSMLGLTCGGCAARMGVTPVEATLAEATLVAAPPSTPQAVPGQPAGAEPALAGIGSENSPAPPAPATGAPAATASSYVFAPAEPPISAQRDAAPRERRDERPEQTPGEVRLVVVASVPVVASGAIVTVDVMASSSSSVVDAPLHLTFDPNVLAFVDGAPGDFLTQGGSSMVFLADGSSRPGDVAIAAGRVERDHGASGAGLLCRVRFRGIGAGTTPVLVGEAKAWGTRGEALTVLAGRTDVVVR